MNTNFIIVENLLLNFLNVGVLIFLFLYVVFAVLIIRQVQLMSRVVISGVNKYVIIFSIFHFLFAIIFFAIYLLNIL